MAVLMRIGVLLGSSWAFSRPGCAGVPGGLESPIRLHLCTGTSSFSKVVLQSSGLKIHYFWEGYPQGGLFSGSSTVLLGCPPYEHLAVGRSHDILAD